MRRIMRHVGERRLLELGLILVAMLVATPTSAWAQEAPSGGGGAATRGGEALPPDILAAQDFLFAAYPDLQGRELDVTLRRDGGAILVSVVDRTAPNAEPLDPGRPAPEPPLSEPRGFSLGVPSESQGVPSEPRGFSLGEPALPVPILTARFEFDADTRLRRYDAYGPLVHEAEALALQMQLLTNPRWHESDADAWLAPRGVASTFAPAPAAVATRASAVSAHLASAASRRSPSSEPRGAEAPSSEPRGFSLGEPPPARFAWLAAGTTAAGGPVFRSRPAWVTTATIADPDSPPILYQLEYEPFGGRLIAVTAQEAQ